MKAEDYSWLRLSEIVPDDRDDLYQIGAALNHLHSGSTLTEPQERLLNLVTRVASFMLYAGEGQEPFGPIMRTTTGRSAVPEDLSEEDLSTLADLAGLEMHSLLKARFNDILWFRKHGNSPHLNGQSASESYLAAFKESTDQDKWITLGTQFQRGLKLAKTFGRDKPLFVSYGEAIEEHLGEIEATTLSWDARWYLQCKAEASSREPDYLDLAKRTFKIGERIHRSGEPDHCSSYYEQAHLFFLKAHDEESAKLANRREGQMALMIARKDYKRSKMAAAHHLAKGIKFLDDAGASKPVRNLLRRKLLRWQRESRNEYSSFSQEAEIDEFAKKARQLVTHDSLEDAVFAFASGYPLISYEKLESQVREQASQSLVNFLGCSSLIAADGRTIANLSSLEDNSDRETVENHMISHARMFDWNFRAQGFINVARWQMLSQHHPTSDSLAFLVRGNPAIPEGHEELFLRGIVAGFHGDGVLSLSLLAPQLEGLVRHNLQRSGAVTSTLGNDFTQDERTLGTLLDTEESRNYFGEDLSLELRGILCTRHGYNLRNEIAHGMLPAHGFFSAGGLNLWWLAIYILAIARNQSDQQQRGAPLLEDSPATESPEQMAEEALDDKPATNS